MSRLNLPSGLPGPWMPLAIVVPLVLALFTQSCAELDGPDELLFRDGVFVLNEGNFGTSNGSIDFAGRGAEVIRDAYQKVQLVPPGDVVQALDVREDDKTGWLVVNNSGKVEKIQLSTLEVLARAEGLLSPRHTVEANGKLFVSDLFSNSITVLDTAALAFRSTIQTDSWTEQMILTGQKIYAVAPGSDELLIIDPASESIIQRVSVGREPLSLTEDVSGKLWILCTGGFREELPMLQRFDPLSAQVDRELQFSSVDDYPTDLCVSASGELLWLNGGLFEMNTASAALPEEAAVDAAGRNFYSLGVDPLTAEVYLADARDFVRAGTIWRYTQEFIEVDSFECGIIPGAFAFTGP